jgi:hypothetical protein
VYTSIQLRSTFPIQTIFSRLQVFVCFSKYVSYVTFHSGFEDLKSIGYLKASGKKYLITSQKNLYENSSSINVSLIYLLLRSDSSFQFRLYQKRVQKKVPDSLALNCTQFDFMCYYSVWNFHIVGIKKFEGTPLSYPFLILTHSFSRLVAFSHEVTSLTRSPLQGECGIMNRLMRGIFSIGN